MNAPPASQHPISAVTTFRPLLVGVVLLNLLVIGATLLSLRESRAQYDERAAATTSNLAQVLEQYVDGVVDKADLGLLAVVAEAERELAAGAIDGPALNAFITRQFWWQSDIDALRVTDVQGQILYGFGTTPLSRVNVSDREYFIRLSGDANAGLVFSKPVMGRISGKWILILARRINRPDGSFAGIATAPVIIEHFLKMFSTLDIGKHGAIALRDEDLSIVARYPEQLAVGSAIGNKVISRELQELTSAGARTGTFTTRWRTDNIERVLSYRKVAEHPLAIIVGLATDDYLAPWKNEVFERIAYWWLFASITLSGAWMFYRIWVRKAFAQRLEQQVQERTTLLRAMAVELATVEERERHSIAQDLHDDLGQTLAIAKLKLTSLDTQAVGDDGLVARIKEIETMIDSANRSLRSLSRQLSPPVLHQFGLVPALEWLADEMHDAYGLRVRIHDDGKPKILDEACSNMLFRAVRELLINVHKHARATSADVELSVNDEFLTIGITDDGTGFDARQPVTPSERGGFGLFSVGERIGHFGGEMHIDSTPGDGTVVVLTVPLMNTPGETGK